MSIWARFKRWIKSIFGGAISALEDPRLILEQNIRELNDQVPKMNENIATVKANVMLLQKEVRRYEAEMNDLTAKIKAGIQAGRDDIAEQYALRLENVREALTRTREQLKYASAAYDKALQVKKAFMREKERKIQEAKDALRAHERAKWQAKIADTLEQFEVAGVDATHDEMITRINEETARQEARMELALDSIDTEAMRIEEDAQKIRAQELVKQFKLEMGVGEPAAPQEEPRLEVPEEQVEQGKTIGKQRSQTE
ncbi:PspA/IM30 family protein [Rhodocaloribacter litoris]|uniref:PspA/IM30 family protein n=1 Tax=Rhodocaloribacter litoris TaxID=2558931 RepID=UPI001423AD68|nr:PspA/IM30 family protein [Rhodocaloribacter litoris]QXD16955.1 PspA/IM30 family protein [Rhodocaloribacter litoris]